MTKRKRNMSSIVAVVAVLAAGAGWCFGQETAKPVDPSPPVLKAVRWQYLDPKFQDVFIDGSGRAWFLIRTFSRASGGKLPSVFLTCPDLPDDYIEMPGENRIIGFDSKDRFWEVGKHGLCCTDVRTGRFTQHKPVPGVDVSQWGNDQYKLIPSFSPQMLEHSTGRLYFVDSVGIHVLDGDRWSYELLLAPRTRWGSVKLVEGPDGKVFVWQPGEYFNTLFVHDGTSWERFPVRDNPKLVQAVEIVPEADGWVSVSSSAGVPRQVKLYDSTTANKVPKATSRRTVKRFDYEFLSRAGEEMSLFGPALGQDKDGRVYFMLNPATTRSIAVLDDRQAATEPTLKYQAFVLHNTTEGRALAVDSLRGIWARLSVEDHPFLSRYADGKYTHFADPDPKNARGAPAMANPARLQAMKNGCMVAVEYFSNHAFAFNGRSWSEYESTRILVEARYDWLKANMDNRGMAWQDCVFLGLDATGKVWLRFGDMSGAYNGEQWQTIPKGSFRFNAAGDRCLCGDFLLQTSVWPPKELALVRPRGHNRLWGRLMVDNKGGLVPTNPFLVESYAPNTSDKNCLFVRGVSETEGAKHAWVCYTTSGTRLYYNLQAIWPDGRRSKPYQHPFEVNHQVVHQGADVYWAAASNGLLRLRLQGQSDAARVVLDKLYPRIIPQGEVTWMASMEDGALWMATRGGKSGLYRIEIPPLTEGK